MEIPKKMKVPSIKTLRLADAASAHELLEARKTSGKMVIKPWA